MLTVNNISYSYTPKKSVLQSVSFTLNQGNCLCVMGESGSGKSTLLKIIYGLIDATDGKIYWKNTPVLGPSHNLVPGIPFFKYVAQDFDLMPYTSVEENIAKFLSRFQPTESKKRVEELLDVIEMTAFAKQKVKTLSGGQQQRVAIARALAKEPELILLDEPFSQIDNFKKNTLSRSLFSYLKKNNIACIVATHDSDDALSFADKMIVLKDQKINAKDCPRNLYKYPPNKYVAGLFNDVNEIEINKSKHLLYPDDIKIVSSSDKKGHVINSYFKGTHWLLEVSFLQQTLFVNHPENISEETVVFLLFKTRGVIQ